MDLSLPVFGFVVVALLRLALGGPLLLFWSSMQTGHRAFASARNWLIWSVMGIFSAITPFLLIGWGISHTGPAVAAIVNGLVPVWTLLLTTIFRVEHLLRYQIWGTFIAISGVTLVIAPRAYQSSEEIGWMFLMGCGAISLASFLYGANLLVTRWFLDRYKLTAVEHTGGFMGASGIVALILLILYNPPWADLVQSAIESPLAAFSVLGLSWLSTSIAYAIFVRLIVVGGAVFASLSILQTPVTSAIMAAILMSEKLSVTQAAGMLIMLIGLLTVEWRSLLSIRKFHSNQS